MNGDTFRGRTLRIPRRLIVTAAVILVLFSGCLPHSCQREPNKALFAADSLSRRVAGEAPVDTLEQGPILGGGRTDRLSYPRTVRFVKPGTLAVSDVKRNSLFLYGEDGTLRREISEPDFSVPYLIGTRSDTLVVYNAESDRVDWVPATARRPARSFTFTRPAPETLVYMVASDTAVYAKVVGQKTGASLFRLTSSGRRVAEVDLRGPYWRRAGFLRTWGDRLVSLSGFRPVIQTLPLGFRQGARPDSLSLVGFDSPMLERSFAFARGDATKPPLLMASAVPVGQRLFVLNLRPGWVQIDVYSEDGRLERRLVEGQKEGNRNFYPVDIDARRTDDGYLFAVAVRSPRAQVELFHWPARPPQTPTDDRAP